MKEALHNPRPVVLFDLDGTLLDSIHDIATCCNAALAENGFPTHSVTAYRAMVGNGADMLVQRALPPDSRCAESVRRVRRSYDAIYLRACSEGGGTVFAGIRDLLGTLRSAGVLLGVVSNKPHDQTDTICRCTFARALDGWQGQRPGVPLKPDPSGLYLLAEHLGGSCVAYVGDSEVDIATGLRANIPAIGVSWGFRSRSQLVEAGAKQIANYPSQLLQMLLDIVG